MGVSTGLDCLGASARTKGRTTPSPGRTLHNDIGFNIFPQYAGKSGLEG